MRSCYEFQDLKKLNLDLETPRRRNFNKEYPKDKGKGKRLASLDDKDEEDKDEPGAKFPEVNNEVAMIFGGQNACQMKHK